MKILGFKIWYSDHTVVGKTYSDWVNAPDNDIQIIMLYVEDPDPEGVVPLRRIAEGNDFYSLDENLELGQGDDASQLSGHIKNGKWTTDELIEQLRAEAAADYTGGGALWEIPQQSPPKGMES